MDRAEEEEEERNEEEEKAEAVTHRGRNFAPRKRPEPDPA